MVFEIFKKESKQLIVVSGLGEVRDKRAEFVKK